MFSKVTNSSKLSLLYLISILIKNNFELLDSQFYNAHLIQFGAFEISDFKYQDRLEKSLEKKCLFNNIDYSDSISILQSLTQTS